VIDKVCYRLLANGCTPHLRLYDRIEIAYNKPRIWFERPAQSAPSGRFQRTVYGDPLAARFLSKK
jgi:hypothetical protein